MHAARLSSIPGELLRYPLFDSLHPRPENITALSLVVVAVVVVLVVIVLVVVVVVAAVVVVGVVIVVVGVVVVVVVVSAVDLNLTAVAPLRVTRLSHVVLK